MWEAPSCIATSQRLLYKGSTSSPPDSSPGAHVSKLIASVGGAIALIVGVGTIVGWVHFSHPKSTDVFIRPPRVTELTLKRSRLSYAAYRRQLKGAAELAFPISAQPDDLGLQLEAELVVENRAGERFSLRWRMYETRTGGQVKGPDYDSQVAFRTAFRMWTASFPVWVPYPPRKGSYFVTLSVLDENGQPISHRNSQRFTIVREPTNTEDAKSSRG